MPVQKKKSGNLLNSPRIRIRYRVRMYFVFVSLYIFKFLFYKIIGISSGNNNNFLKFVGRNSEKIWVGLVFNA